MFTELFFGFTVVFLAAVAVSAYPSPGSSMPPGVRADPVSGSTAHAKASAAVKPGATLADVRRDPAK